MSSDHTLWSLVYSWFIQYFSAPLPPKRVTTANSKAQRQKIGVCVKWKELQRDRKGEEGGGVKIHSGPHFQLGSASCYHRCVRIEAVGAQMSKMNPYLRHKAGPWHIIWKLLSFCTAYMNFIPVWWHYPLFALFGHLNAWLQEKKDEVLPIWNSNFSVRV